MSNVQPVLADPKHLAPLTSAADLHDSLKPSNPFTDGTTSSTATDANGATHAGAQQTVMFRSDKMPADTPICRGYDFNNGIDYDALFRAYATTGFQATNMSLAMDQINSMIRWRLSDEPLPDGETEEEQPVDRSTVRCTIFLGYTSNMISCGVRETIRYLCQHKMVDAIVTSAGGVEEDFMKCLAPHYMGDFKLDGKGLRIRGFNRIGNLLVPNTNYCAFEEWINPILDEMVREQVEEKKVWSPSSMIARFGREIKNEESVYYWCYKNNIPVFCPALTDGSIGDMIYFHGSSNTPLIVDIAQDIRALNDIALLADKSGMIILGGGTPKHQICNANLMRNGADYSVYINTGVDWDGSDSGAAPDEAVSWGKIKVDAKPVKVNGDASLIFPLVVSQTFAKHKAMYDELNNPNKKKAAPRVVKI